MAGHGQHPGVRIIHMADFRKSGAVAHIDNPQSLFVAGQIGIIAIDPDVGYSGLPVMVKLIDADYIASFLTTNPLKVLLPGFIIRSARLKWNRTS